jgi:hypothetical protein
MFRPRRTTTDTPTDTGSVREIDRRVADGLEVRLDWNERTGDVRICVFDHRNAARGAATVAPERALHAFRHPFVYLDIAPAGA